MPTISELTVEQFQDLLKEFFAVQEKRQKMTPIEITDLAKRLNKKINVPIINETQEEKILIKIVLEVDTFLYNNLPNEFYDLIRSVDKGIDDDEAKRLIVRLSKLANEKIDIPYIPEQMEYIAIRFILSIVINAARKKIRFDEAADKLQNVNIPETENVTDMQLAALIV
ncbi:MAG: hypothetical protein AB7S48_00295 [Bacteroidales bacterium]